MTVGLRGPALWLVRPRRQRTDCLGLRPMSKSSSEMPLPVFAFQLRALVLALGESADPPWWKTEFMNETGLRFLERLYPRSFFRAAVHAAGKAACDVHDGAVGRVGVFHLFRLPEGLEMEIYEPRPDDDELLAGLRPHLGKTGDLMERLAGLSAGEKGGDASGGAKLIGQAGQLAKAAGLAKTAAVYYRAFRDGKSTFPYFTGGAVG